MLKSGRPTPHKRRLEITRKNILRGLSGRAYHRKYIRCLNQLRTLKTSFFLESQEEEFWN
jgi:hypothetical protein